MLQETSLTLPRQAISPAASAFDWTSEAQARRRRYRLAISVSHHINLRLGRWFPRVFPFVYVVGFPKSGTTWGSQLVADGLNLPYPQHSVLPFGCATVLQTHTGYSESYPRAVYMVRDGRDVMVSLYFHLIANRDADSGTAARYRSIRGLGTADSIRQDLPEFIRGQARRPFSAPLNWGQHVESYFRHSAAKAPCLRYETLRKEGEQALSSVLEALLGHAVPSAVIQGALERYSFQRLTGRKEGTESRNSHLRKGQSGDWRNHFTPAAAEVFQQHFGKALVMSGYEADDRWIDETRDARAA